MIQRGERELLEAIRPRYLKASKTEKTQILDELVAVTGYHRKRVIRLVEAGRETRASEEAGLAEDLPRRSSERPDPILE